MKTYHIKDLLKKELLILELPRVCDYKLTKEMIFIMDKERSTIHRFKASYTPLGKPEEIKESDAEELVESGDADPAGDRFVLGYRSYFEGYEDDIPQFTCETATESLLSAIESVIFWKNPFGKEEPKCIRYGTSPERIKNLEWREAELRTFDRNRTLIFVKN